MRYTNPHLTVSIWLQCLSHAPCVIHDCFHACSAWK